MTFDLITGLIRDFGAAQRASREVKRLHLASDATLAKMDLERSDIVSHAFNAHFKRRG